MTIYNYLVTSVQEETKQFRIDLKKKSLRVGKKQIIENGKIVDENFTVFIDDKEQHSYEKIEQLYTLYKCSIPQEKTYGNKPYFKAVSIKDLKDEELVLNEQRTIAQAMLEGYILCAGLQGTLKWEDENKWFWQSEKYKDLIVLKEWVL